MPSTPLPRWARVRCRHWPVGAPNVWSVQHSTCGRYLVRVPWSYISPISWWDHNDNSFGVRQLTASSSSYEAGDGAGSSSFANNWWNEQSSSTSASVGVSFGFAGSSADYSHSDAECLR